MSAARPIHALAAALDIGDAARADTSGETVNVAGAAKLLHTTERGIYLRRQKGKMPVPVTRRPLVWRKADLLKDAK